MKNKITALYCRVSKEDRYGDSSSSINTQKHFLIRYAYSNNFKNTKLYIDDGVSGTNFKRPGFNRLKNDIENGLVSNQSTPEILARTVVSVGVTALFNFNHARFINQEYGYESFVMSIIKSQDSQLAQGVGVVTFETLIRTGILLGDSVITALKYSKYNVFD